MPSSDPIRKNNVNILGNPQSPRTMIFIHGFGTEQTSWEAITPAFSKDFRIILFDHAGAGHSAPDSFVQHKYLNLNQYALDLLSICAALNVKNAVGVGHSLGAMVAVLAANATPGVFAELILLGASPRYLNDENYHGGFTEDDLNNTYSAVMQNFAGWAEEYAPLHMDNPERPDLSQAFAECIKSIPAERVLTLLCSIFQSDHREDVAKLSLPTLLIQSKHDLAVPLEVAEFLHREIARSELQVIDSQGHLPHISAPDKVIAAMRGFL